MRALTMDEVGFVSGGIAPEDAGFPDSMMRLPGHPLYGQGETLSAAGDASCAGTVGATAVGAGLGVYGVAVAVAAANPIGMAVTAAGLVLGLFFGSVSTAGACMPEPKKK